MLATATHDTKRGEDARARLAVLSEMPEAWAEAVRGVARAATPPSGRRSSTPRTSTSLYQALVGVWPEGSSPATRRVAALRGHADVACAATCKALREAKERTSWLDPDAGYEEEALGFVDALSTRPSRAFLDAAAGLRQPRGARRPRQLAGPAPAEAHRPRRAGHLPGHRAVGPQPGRPRQPPPRRLAGARGPAGRRPPGRPGARLGRRGDQDAGAGPHPRLPPPAARALRRRRLPAAGPGGREAGHAFAFARRQGGLVAVTLVGRHQAALLDPGRPPPAPPERWGDTALVLPEDLAGTAFEDRLTGATLATAGPACRCAGPSPPCRWRCSSRAGKRLGGRPGIRTAGGGSGGHAAEAPAAGWGRRG